MAVVLLAPEMVKRARESGRQPHPEGELKTVDDVVRERVREALRAKGWQQKDLALKIPVVPASITNLLKPGPPRQIRYLDRLYEVLGIEDQLQEVMDGWIELPPEVRSAIAAIVASHRKQQRR